MKEKRSAKNEEPPKDEIGYVKPRFIEAEMQESYLDYAMSVIVARALPDVRDGLKPVHRRVLYAMSELGLHPTAKYRKSATVVGEVLGKYHPHGDVAVYDSLVRLAQNFAMRYPLVDGQGNFGSLDGDPAAAMRYCVTADTLIPTNQGLVRIGEISPHGNENIEIEVLSKNRTVNKADKWFDSGNHPTVKITTAKGLTLRGSTNHPLLIWSAGQASAQPSFEWRTLDQIKKGDIAVIDRTPDLLWPAAELDLRPYWPAQINNRAEVKTLPAKLDEDLAHILGALIAEGTLKKKELEFCNNDEQWMEQFRERWQSVFPDCRLHYFKRSPNSFGKKPYATFEIHSQHVIRFLNNLGLVPAKSGQRAIPFTILRSPKSVMTSFLQAYFEGDGSISYSGKMTELSAVSKSETLIKELQLILLRFGIAGSKRYDKYRDTNKLYIRGLTNYLIFQKNIGFVSDRKNIKLRAAIDRLGKDYSQTDFVPLLANFTRSSLTNNYNTRKEFAAKHNFDRYPAMKTNYQKVLTAVEPAVRTDLRVIFEQLLENNYLFDPIVNVENAGVERVYSIKVQSSCHSFVGNGFVNHNTESKLAPIAEELLADLQKETVDFRDNYDATKKEPSVLPAKLPNLLLNGSLGIAVGMATDIPPHNLREVAAAATALIDNPKITSEDLMNYVQGPDFPTGGIIYDWEAIKAAYATGKGSVVVRAKTEITEGPPAGDHPKGDKGAYRILITEIPYRVNKASLLEKFAELVQGKKIDGIRDLRDESDKDGVRIVVDLKKDALPNKVLNQLFNYTQLQDSFHLNMLALVEGLEPRVLNLKMILEYYLKHRREVVVRRTRFDLARTRERVHILEGLKKALDHIDAIIKTIKQSDTKEIAHAELQKKFKLSALQSSAILEMRLAQLAGLERKKLETELKEKLALMAELEALLKSPKKIDGLIKKDLEEIGAKYGDERRTKLVKQPIGEFKVEDLIADEDVIIVTTKSGYVKRLPPDTYRKQGRGGKGVIGITTKEADVVEHLLTASTHDDVFFFTNRGRVFQTKVYELPEASRTAKGQALVNFLELQAGEMATAILTFGKTERAKYKFLVMGTKSGTVKKTSIEEFAKVRRSGLIAIGLHKGDELKWVKMTSGEDEIMMTTKNGQAIRFREKDVRAMGRTAAGVRGIRVKSGDEVMSLDVIAKGVDPKNLQVLVISEQGLGKKTNITEYKVQGRGGSGIKTMNITKKTGPVKVMRIVSRSEEGDLVVISRAGQTIRTALGTISTLGRSTQGVRVMRLDPGDTVASATII